jgi:hypothetical protein
VLEQLIDYITGHPGVWFGSHAATASYVATTAGLRS